MSIWDDLTPSKRCDWIDQLRGWAVIVMIEVHAVNVWLHAGLRPDWLNYLNGLVAPSFTLAAGYSLVISTFRTDGTLRPFWPDTARRLGFILLCAYALHAPGITAADWTVLNTAQKARELFKIDVLQCIVFSLLILQGLARLVRNPRVFTVLALALAIFVPLVSPSLWATGVADGLWLPIRGLFNGNPDRGVQALFPLFPWFAFPAFGAFLGGLYRHFRVVQAEGKARWSEARFLAGLAVLGAMLLAWGASAQHAWLWGGTWLQHNGVWMLHSKSGAFTYAELGAISNATLPSVAARLGWILLGGALMGAVDLLRPRWKGPNPIDAASRESLLLYMLHLNLIFSVLLAPAVVALTGWGWGDLGWAGTLSMTALIIALNLAVGVWWQKVRKTPDLMRRLQHRAVAVLGVWFVLGGWWTFRHFLQSPELAKEPYGFLNAARARKGLPPTPDGLCRDPEEYFREAGRRKLHLSDEAKADLARQILARGGSR
ncbi:heparan-alpha-glucosaminide N-acetyltransferase domain-containing protein [Geothrix alkalitolerans]|uniref:heparan-alpha-glucosaminide N-acetyltransferase domain-containing protein n=1 Tax=Geothrix alkalitolerans TaxID=2922724 RepID=UPI001FAF9A36|nr:heparan-alpha-glucosaminide N-acetyltransferase domain-containing protein [Geothrix alkalitolerans]